MSLSFAASIWAELALEEVALDDAAANVGVEDGEIGIGAKSGVMVTRWSQHRITCGILTCGSDIVWKGCVTRVAHNIS